MQYLSNVYCSLTSSVTLNKHKNLKIFDWRSGFKKSVLVNAYSIFMNFIQSKYGKSFSNLVEFCNIRYGFGTFDDESSVIFVVPVKVVMEGAFGRRFRAGCCFTNLPRA